MKIGGIQKFSTVDYPGYTCAAIFTIGCNMRCGYCHNPELVLPDQYTPTIPEELIFDFLETRKGLLDAVAISGGEPTMQEDLVEFIGKVKDMGFRVKLDSNGTHPDMLEELIGRKMVDFVAMDIKGPYSKYHQIAARPTNLDAIRRSIELIKNGVDHEFRTTIVRSQLEPEDFKAIGKMVDGAQRFALQQFQPGKTLVPQFANEMSFNDEEMQQARNYLLPHVAECVVH